MPFSIVAALATGVVSMVLGFLWYGPLFAKAWTKEVGLKESEVNSGAGAGYLLAFLSSTLLGGVTSLIMHFLGVTDLAGGAVYGSLLGIGYVLTTFATNYTFARKSLKLYLIDGGYQFLLVVLAGIIAALV